MYVKYLLGGALLLALAGQAISQPVVHEFYIVRNPDRKCIVVDKKPTTTTTVTVVGDRVYKTRTEAESAIRTVCTD